MAKAQKQKTKENVQISEIRRYNIKYMSDGKYLKTYGTDRFEDSKLYEVPLI